MTPGISAAKSRKFRMPICVSIWMLLADNVIGESSVLWKICTDKSARGVPFAKYK
jgi:hypothetical protein